MRLERDEGAPASRAFPLGNVLFALAASLAAAAALPAGTLRLAVVLACSGLPFLLVVRRRWSISELAAAPAIASLAIWTLLSGVSWELATSPLSPAVLAVATGALGLWARRSGRTLEIERSASDAIALLALGVALIATGAVCLRNGPAGDGYLARGWFGRDTFYFLALAQGAIEQRGAPAGNPFVAGVPNFYPSLFHTGFGALTVQHGPLAALAVRWIAPPVLASAVGLLANLCIRAVAPRGGDRARALAVGLGVVASAVTLRPDLFIYPQTHAFGFAVLLLAMWLWRHDAGDTELVGSIVVATLVICGHTVTGGAAVAFLAGKAALVSRSERPRLAGAVVLVVAGLAVTYWRVSTLPFAGASAGFRWGGEGAPSGALGPWCPSVGFVVLLLLGNLRSWRHLVSSLVLVALGGAYLVHGGSLVEPVDRWFVFFNAERFFLLALLLAIPALGVVRLPLAAAAVVGVLAGAVLLPTTLSRETATLFTGVAQELDRRDLETFEILRRRTPAEARFFTNLRDYALPAFTGRAQNPHQENIWALHTLPAREFDERLADLRWFDALSPRGRLDLLDRRGYTHFLLRGRLGSREQSEAWVARTFPGGTMRILVADDRYLVTERVRRPR